MIGLRRLLAAIRERSKPTEDASDPDGALSYAGEWHALAVGIGSGFTAAVTGQPVILAGLIAVALGISGREIDVSFGGRGVVHEVKREPWYATGGGLIAYTVMGGRIGELVGLLPV
jgi:hypothetical protein